MQRIEGVVKHYAWGDTQFIPELLGVYPDGRPWAELWLGTHADGAARLDDGRPLVDECGQLPYLLKVLAAGQPLSLQTHPDADLARDGFARGIYPDPNPKPELLRALTPFTALCGIRPIHLTISLLGELGATAMRRVVAADGPGAALAGLYDGRLDPWPAIEACAHSDRVEARWVRWLDALYPGEPSVAATLLLNLVELRPGEALRLDAGNLHAYLRGAGVELMGPSDNVVRAGLTEKPVDVDELMRVLDTTPLAEPVLPVADRHDLPAAGVALVRLPADTPYTATGHELTIDVAGASYYLAPGDVIVVTAETFVVTPT